MFSSIVIPFYNQKPEYLRQAIQSALNQQFAAAHFEVIAVDDGSQYPKDKPNPILPMLEEFAAQYHNFKHTFKTNGGTASALNAGIRLAQGNWIKWLSSDDILKPNYLSTLWKEMKESS